MYLARILYIHRLFLLLEWEKRDELRWQDGKNEINI